MNYRRPQLRDRLAAEYVLGTLHGAARARLMRLLRDDVELVERVAFWERHLTTMASTLSTSTPSVRVWEAIDGRIRTRVPIGAQEHIGALRRFLRWFDSRSMGMVTAGLLLGFTLAAMLPNVLQEFEKTPAIVNIENQLPDSYVGVLATQDGRTGLIVSSLRQGSVMDVKTVMPVPVASGSTMFLWAIDANGNTRPIGALPLGAFVQVPLTQPSEKLFASAIELAVSIEPLGTPPTQAAGAFVYRGLCGKLWRVPAKATP